MAKEEKKPDAEAPAAEQEGGGEAPAKNPKKKKIMMIAGGGGVVLLIVVGLVVKGMLSKHDMAAKAPDAEHAEEAKGDEHGDKKEEEKKDEHGDKKEEEKKDEHGEKKDEHGEKKDEHGEKKDEHGEKKGEEPADGEHKAKTDGASNVGEVYQIPRIDLNLGNPIENRFLRIALALEFRGGEAQMDELKKRQAQLNDIIITTASSKTRAELLTETGKNRLRRELLNKFNEVCERPIDALYYTEFFVE